MTNSLLKLLEDDHLARVVTDCLFYLNLKGEYVKIIVPGLGYTREELINDVKSTFKIIHPDDTALVKEKLREYISGEHGLIKDLVNNMDIVKTSFRVLNKQDEYRVIEANSIFVEDPDQGYLILNAIKDITDYKNVETKLQYNKERFKELVENMSSGVAVYKVIDGNFVFKDFNSAGEKIDSIKREELIGKNVVEMFPGINDFGLLDVFKRVYETGLPETHPVSKYKDNRIIGWRNNYVYRLSNGEIIAVYDDITKQVEIDEEQRILSSICSATNEAITLKDLYDNILNNLVMIDGVKGGGIYLVKEERAKIMHSVNLPDEFISEADNIKIDQGNYSQIFIEGKPLFAGDYEQVNPERAKKFDIKSVVSVPIYTEEEVIGAVNIAFDAPKDFPEIERNFFMTIGKQIGTAIKKKQNEELYFSLFNNLPNIALLIEPINNESGELIDFCLVDYNKNVDDFIKLDKSNFINKKYSAFHKIVPHDFSLINIIKDALSNNGKTEFYSKDFNLWHSLTVYDASDNKTGLIFEDITKVKKAEIKSRLNEERLEKMNLIQEKIIHKISHAFRTPQIGPKAAPELIRMHLENGEYDKIEEALVIMEGGVNKWWHLSNSINEYVSIAYETFSLSKDRVNLNDLIKNTYRDIDSYAVINRVKTELDLVDEERFVLMDYTKMLHVLKEVLFDAVNFNSSKIKIKSFSEEPYYIVSIEDDGQGFTETEKEAIGISPSERIKRKILDSSFTQHQKKNIEGLYLGSFVVDKIIREHGFILEVISEGEGKGTKVRIKMPIDQS